MLDHSANPGGGSTSSDLCLAPPDDLCQLAFRQTMPVEPQGISPSILQLASRQPSEEGQPSFSDDAIDGNGASEASFLPFCLSQIQHPSWSDFPDMQEPMGIPDHSFGIAEDQEFVKGEIDEGLFANPETGELANLDDFFADTPQDLEHMDIDEYLTGTAKIPDATETDEQLFDRPEIRELVNIPDDYSHTPETPESMQIDVEEPEDVSDCRPPSPALSSPLSSAPPSPVSPHPEPENRVYLVERIVQAWGSQHRRQYLIRWEGWGPESDTWEPAGNVSAELRAEFERSHWRRRYGRRWR